MNGPLDPGPEGLTGVESRALRAVLGLERRHVALLAKVLGLGGGKGMDPNRVVQWERSKGRGYPPDVLSALLSVLHAVQDGAGALRAQASVSGAIRRPLGDRGVFTVLHLDRAGLRLTPGQLAGLDADASGFWQHLADAMVTHALILSQREGRNWPVVLDRAPRDCDPSDSAGPENETVDLAEEIKTRG